MNTLPLLCVGAMSSAPVYSDIITLFEDSPYAIEIDFGGLTRDEAYERARFITRSGDPGTA